MFASFAQGWLLSIFVNFCFFSDFAWSLRDTNGNPVVGTSRYKRNNFVPVAGYTELSIPKDGSAHATSTYSSKYGPEKAFKVRGVLDRTYWCSIKNPQKPVTVWFQFRKPKCVTKIKFGEMPRYKLPSGKEYVIFASNTSNACDNQTEQTVLANGTADLFDPFGMEFKNKQKFICYGLRMLDQSDKGYVAVRWLQFGINELSEKELIKNCRKGNYDYVKEQAERFGEKDVIDARGRGLGESCLTMVDWRKRAIVCHQQHTKSRKLCKDRLKLVEFLLAIGADVNEIPEDKGRYSALGAVTKYGDIEVMRLLLDAGADVDIRDGWEERTPILRISESASNVTGYPELKLLLEYNATIDARDKHDVSALRKAIYDNNLNLALELVKNGASVKIAEDSKFNQEKFERQMQITRVQQIIEEGRSLFEKRESPFGNTTGELLDLSEGKANATSVLSNDIKLFGAEFAFKRQKKTETKKRRNKRTQTKIQSQFYPWSTAWISGRQPSPDQPETVWILLPRNVTISALRMTSWDWDDIMDDIMEAEFRNNSIYYKSDVRKAIRNKRKAGDFVKMMPTEFEIVGSNDCKTWTTLLEVKAKWFDLHRDMAQKWRIPIKDRQPFSCIGIRVKANEKRETAIQGVQLWE